KMDAKSDLYIYFYFHGLSLLNDKGAFCFITSNSWLDVGYGADLQEFLLKQCHVKMVLDNQSRRSFASADVNTIIALFSPPSERRECGLERTARFVMFKVPFEQVLSPVVFKEIEATAERKATPEYRVFPIRQDRLLEDGCELPEDEETRATQREKSGRRASGPLIKVARYIGNKWGGKYLRAPDIYWTVVDKGGKYLVRLGDIALVRPGCYAGINDFFYLSKEVAGQWGIEAECLRPMIRTSRDILRPHITPQDMEHYVFFCPFSKSEMKAKGLPGALAYIDWGEKQVTRHRQKTAAGIPWPKTETVKYRSPGWWAIPAQNVEPTRNFLLYVIGERFLAPWSNKPLSSDRCFHRLFCPNTMSDQLGFSMNCTLTFLFISLFGRGNLGQGAQKYETADAKCLLLFNPASLPDKPEWEDIIATFGKRQVLPIAEEIASKDRHRMDNVIFDALRLTRGEREAVYEAVISLVETRLKKASSLDPKQLRSRGEAVRKTVGIWSDLPASSKDDDRSGEE
ncbi:MAG: Eco57I restriction-modification methylase domain-containing protein, partial [Syntrophales bacterium]|nr:Eco57I restriction-modification methylase domain-containing protein [Syntrophales bacterium]